MSELTKIMECLGAIQAKLDQMSSANMKITLALIGVIAAQIGVKVLGSDPLLDVATALGLLGAVLVAGALVMGLKLSRKNKAPLTRTGMALFVMMSFLFITNIAVYFRDLGLLNYRIIYGIRIVQNITIITFAWFLMTKSRLFHASSNKPKDSCSVDGQE